MGKIIFGVNSTARLHIPKGSASWQIGDFLEKDKYSNILLLSFSMNDQETVDIRRCFNETNHIFAFGRNIAASSMDVTVLMLMASGCPKIDEGSWLKIDELRSAYDENRIYKKLAPLDIKIDDFSTSGYLVRMSIGGVDPALKACTVTFSFIINQES